VADPELARRTQHALRHDATDLALLDLEVTRQHRADACERHDHAGLDVRRATDHAELAVAVVDVGEPDAIGVRMRHDVEDPRHDHAIDLATGLVDLFDLDAELVQRVGDVGGRCLHRREFTDPGERCAHGYRSLANRTSPSQRFFTWSTPYSS